MALKVRIEMVISVEPAVYVREYGLDPENVAGLLEDVESYAVNQVQQSAAAEAGGIVAVEAERKG